MSEQRVSDEWLTERIEAATQTRYVHTNGVVSAWLILDLASARARIAALEAERDGAYNERNQVVLFAAALASNSWTPVWVQRDPSEPDWPVLGIGLEDEGQVTWHLPPGTDTSIAYSPPQPWDGHTTEEKYARVRAFVERIAAYDAALATTTEQEVIT